jgi:hypothetical protein
MYQVDTETVCFPISKKERIGSDDVFLLGEGDRADTKIGHFE